MNLCKWGWSFSEPSRPHGRTIVRYSPSQTMIYWICHLDCDANVGTLRVMPGEIVGILDRRSVDIFYVQVSRYMGSVLNYVGLVSTWVSWVPCHHAIVMWWGQNFFLWVFRGSKIFSHGYTWVWNFFSWVFRWHISSLNRE